MSVTFDIWGIERIEVDHASVGGNDPFRNSLFQDFTIDGGTGVDTINPSPNTAADYSTFGVYHLDIDRGPSTDSGVTFNKVCSTFENLSTYSRIATLLTGNDAANVLTGSIYQDASFGENKDGTLYGGHCNDALYGGTGRDQFINQP